MMGMEISYDEKRVIVTDEFGNSYHKDWKKTAKDGMCINWTLESEGLPYYISGRIVSVVIVRGETL